MLGLAGRLSGCGHISVAFCRGSHGKADWSSLDVGDAYIHHLPENQIYSVCQQCNTNCGIKVKLVDGMVAKIDGNPYSPWTLTPHIPYKTPLADAATIEGSLCPKGQAGIQALYDPYRLVKVLKRAGKRGENKWKTISFDQAIKEIVEGGNLFGEGQVEGLKDICVLEDSKIAKELADDAKQVAAKKMSSRTSRRSMPTTCTISSIPDHPDLGPKNNQFCLYWGRLKAGRSELLETAGRQRPGFREHPRPHHRVSGIPLFHLQGHERPVRRRQIHGRQQVLLAGGHGQCRVHPLCGRQSL